MQQRNFHIQLLPPLPLSACSTLVHVEGNSFAGDWGEIIRNMDEIAQNPPPPSLSL